MINQELDKILEHEPKFRKRQIEEALYMPQFAKWENLSNLPKELREKLAREVPWISLDMVELETSDEDSTKKALLKLSDGILIETVLMKNSTDKWTVCLSTQAGCPMNCLFCSTGKIGFKRNLTKEEIRDQYRFWLYQLEDIDGQDGDSDKLAGISNLVFMGMGEPFFNYENVRDAITEILKYAEIGQNHIVVSTVGIIDKLEYLLNDKSWPNVRIAISLHSAIDETRKRLIPSHQQKFFAEIISWAKRYQTKLGANKRFLSFEYILIKDLNDSMKEAKAFVKFLNAIGGNLKANLILYNDSLNSELEPSSLENAVAFQNLVKESGFMCTIRKSYGRDIKGACGQLAGNKER